MKQNLAKSGFLIFFIFFCSPSIPLPAPEELEIKQIKNEPSFEVEISWKVVLKADGYLLYYDNDKPGEPYNGEGLCLMWWPSGCGDFEKTSDNKDETKACKEVKSPIEIPVQWCLEKQTLPDGDIVPVETPATRPRVRLKNLIAGKTYYFAVQAFRKNAKSELSNEENITINSKL